MGDVRQFLGDGALPVLVRLAAKHDGCTAQEGCGRLDSKVLEILRRGRKSKPSDELSLEALMYDDTPIQSCS